MRVFLQAEYGVAGTGWLGSVSASLRRPEDWGRWWGISVSARWDLCEVSTVGQSGYFQETARKSRKVVVRAVCCSEDSQDERGEVRALPSLLLSLHCFLTGRHHSGLDFPPLISLPTSQPVF